MNADETRAAVRDLLTAAVVTFSARLVGETVRDNNWKCDAWRVTLSKGTDAKGFKLPGFEGKAETFETDYYTGTGHRKPIKGASVDKGNPGTVYREQWEKRNLRPVTPSAADVLYSLTLDASAADMSFNEWCADYNDGNNDSIKAFNTYQACCAIGKDLARVLDRKTLAELRDLLQDY